MLHINWKRIFYYEFHIIPWNTNMDDTIALFDKLMLKRIELNSCLTIINIINWQLSPTQK